MFAAGLTHPTGIAILVTLVAMLAGSVVQYTFLRSLRRRHPMQWQHAGSPTIWSDQSLLSAWPTISYLTHRRYRGSNDPQGVAHCEAYRTAMLALYWVTACAFAVAVIVGFVFGWPQQWR
jgi:hypothetical protein